MKRTIIMVLILCFIASLGLDTFAKTTEKKVVPNKIQKEIDIYGKIMQIFPEYEKEIQKCYYKELKNELKDNDDKIEVKIKSKKSKKIENDFYELTIFDNDTIALASITGGDEEIVESGIYNNPDDSNIYYQTRGINIGGGTSTSGSGYVIYRNRIVRVTTGLVVHFSIFEYKIDYVLNNSNPDQIISHSIVTTYNTGADVIFGAPIGVPSVAIDRREESISEISPAQVTYQAAMQTGLVSGPPSTNGPSVKASYQVHYVTTLIGKDLAKVIYTFTKQYY